MNTILVPTDFSLVADKAIAVAKLFAQKTAAKIHVANFYSLSPVDYAFPEISTPAELMAQFQKDAEANMNTLASKLKEEGVVVETTVSMGMAADEIVSLADKLNADMIIMGTTGSNTLVNKFIGSNAARVMRETIHPILLIPECCTCSVFNNIIYLAELQDDDTAVLTKIFDLSDKLNAQSIRLLNVNTGFFFKPIDEKLMMKLDNVFGLKKIQLETVDGIDVKEGIEHYLENHSVDLLVMATHKKSFLERLFAKNDTVKMALYTKIPLLIYHKD